MAHVPRTVLQGHLEGPAESHPIRYLYSPLTDNFVSLLNYENDELIPSSEIANRGREETTVVSPEVV